MLLKAPERNGSGVFLPHLKTDLQIYYFLEGIPMNKSNNKVKFITIVGMLSALATILYYIGEVPMPFAAHLKIGFSDLPALIGGIVVGPSAAIGVEVIKNILHLFRTDTFGIGEIANCVVGIGLTVPFTIVFNKVRKSKGILLSYLIASIAGLIGIIISGIVINAIVYPIFMALIGGVIESAQAFIIYLAGTVTTNVVKSVVTLVPIVFFVKPLLKVRLLTVDTQIASGASKTSHV